MSGGSVSGDERYSNSTSINISTHSIKIKSEIVNKNVGLLMSIEVWKLESIMAFLTSDGRERNSAKNC